MSKMKSRVDATVDKIALLQEVQTLLNSFAKGAARIKDKIDVMIDADLQSMEAEKNVIDEMSNIIKNHD